MSQKQWTSTELAYIAGFIDGEGCIALDKSRGGVGFTLSVHVDITYIPTLELLRDMFGGSIYVVKKRSESRKQQYSWQIRGRDAHNFILAILPYLREKKPQAIIANDYFRMFGSNGNRHRLRSEKVSQEHYYRKLQELKKVEYMPGSSTMTKPEVDNLAEQLRLVD